MLNIGYFNSIAKNFRSFFCVLALGVFLSACGDSQQKPNGDFVEPPFEADFHPDVKKKAAVGSIQFDQTMPDDEFLILARQIHALPQAKFSDFPETKKVLGIPDTSGATIAKWFEARIRVILSRDFKQGKVEGCGDEAYACNWSAALYSRPGQPANDLQVQGVGKLVSRSIRTGIVQIGSILDKDDLLKFKDLPQTMARAHWETWGHEARHSDGRGNSFGFSHVPCPEWHDYEGFNACDKISNGSYAAGANILKSAGYACDQCNAKGKQLLQVILADSLSRILPGAVDENATPESEK